MENLVKAAKSGIHFPGCRQQPVVGRTNQENRAGTHNSILFRFKAELKDGSGRKVEATGDRYVKQNEPFKRISGGGEGEQGKIIGVNEQTA